jgi:hypothetical protein
MAQNFAAVAKALPETIRAGALGVSYVAASAAPGLSLIRQVNPLRSTGRGGAASKGIWDTALIGIPRDGGEVHLPPVVPASVRCSFQTLRTRLIAQTLPEQQEWAGHVLGVLRQVQPRLVMVGNDRCWTGQTYTRLARSEGIGTVVLQDGIAAENDPTWAYSTADHVLAGGTLWPRLLDREPQRPKSVVVVGQPRYDGASERFSERRAHSPRQSQPALWRVLLVLQDIHGSDYVRAILREILRVEGTSVRIRAHPGFRPGGLERLAGARVHFSAGGDVVDDLAWADLVVTEYSTVAVEALALGLPVLSVTLSGRPPLLDFTVAGQAEGVMERSQIAPAIARLFAAEAPPPSGSSQRQAILDELVGPLDDRSASRVAGIVGRLLEAGAA